MNLYVHCDSYGMRLATDDANRLAAHVIRLVDLAERSGANPLALRVHIQSLDTYRDRTVKVSARSQQATVERVRSAFQSLSRPGIHEN